MITLHRLGQGDEFRLNPDLILTVEAHPDTVITLTTGNRMVVAESADQVCDAVREWRVALASQALRNRRA
jgi:flagellar protein FlbD